MEQLKVALPAELVREVDRRAVVEERSRSAIVRRALQRQLLDERDRRHEEAST